MKQTWSPLLITGGAALGLASVLTLGGCTHVGPKTVAMDRFDYSTAVADSWKQQTLLNIVKIRYMDLPVFVDVASIVAGYSLQTGVTVNGVLSSTGAVQGNYGALGGQAVYTDRPTITYVPMTGEKFLRGLMSPIDPAKIFFMLQSGYPADFILALTVEGINGLRNRSIAGGAFREADPDFFRLLELFTDVQTAGAVGMRVEEDKVKGAAAVVFFRRDDILPEVIAKADEVRRLLKLPTAPAKFTLTYSPVRGGDHELAVNSRSMLQILMAFSSYVDVPPAHVQEQRVRVRAENDMEPSRLGVRIRSGKEKPADALVAVPYRGHWFWVDDGDWRTKRALTAVMFFFTLADTGGGEKLPLVTIPAQ
jgi:hypothetical protein